MKLTAPLPDVNKTMLRRIEQYQDRWSSFGDTTGIVSISDKLSPQQLKEYEIFQDYDEKFLEKISPDVSVAVWKEGAILFEAGSYIDLAFCLVEGEVEVYLEGSRPSLGESQPIFDVGRTVMMTYAEMQEQEAQGEGPDEAPEDTAGGTRLMPQLSRRSPSEITFLASMDFDLPQGGAQKLGAGEIFGEIGALSGWPQSATVRTSRPSTLIQIRLPALRAMKRKSSALKDRIDKLYRERSLSAQLKVTPLFRDCNDLFIGALKEVVELVSLDPDEVLVREGEEVDCLYLVRSGFLKLLQKFSQGDLVVSYLSKGMSLGGVELLVDELDSWEVTGLAVGYAELVKIPKQAFHNILRNYPKIEEQLWQAAVAQIKETGLARRNVRQSEFTQVALDTGLVQGNSILAIDLSRCTRCDDCVRACAATHDGRPRFVREGNKYENLLIAKSCYHCRDPVCLVGCPTGAIHRAGVGDVVEITDGVCIGCSHCARSCPYDAIVMHEMGETWPDDMVPVGLRGQDRLLASKCDLCYSTGHDPACVTNCPQGCAFRVGSLEEFQDLLARPG